VLKVDLLVVAGVPLKHVDTVDKSQPVIEREQATVLAGLQQHHTAYSLSGACAYFCS
jgi:hypothetical protein